MLTYSSLRRSASFCAKSATARRRGERPGSDPPYACGIFASSSRAAACDLRRIGADLAQHLRHDAFALLDERHQQVLRLDLRVARLARPDAAPSARPPGLFRCICSDSFVVRRSLVRRSAYERRTYERRTAPMLQSSSSRSPASCSASKCARCSGVSSRGSSTSTVAYRSPTSSGLPTAGMPWPFSRNTWPFCVVGGMRSRSERPAERGHVDLAAEHRGRQRHGHARVQVAALALEPRMRRQADAQVQVARLRAAGPVFALRR